MNPGQLYEELQDAGLPVESVNSNGQVTYSRALTPAEEATAAAVIAAHNPALGNKRRRALQAAYQLAQTVNGTNVTALTAVQVRSIMILLAAAQGWVDSSGNNWIVNITAADILQAGQGR